MKCKSTCMYLSDKSRCCLNQGHSGVHAGWPLSGWDRGHFVWSSLLWIMCPKSNRLRRIGHIIDRKIHDWIKREVKEFSHMIPEEGQYDEPVLYTE